VGGGENSPPTPKKPKQGGQKEPGSRRQVKARADVATSLSTHEERISQEASPADQKKRLFELDPGHLQSEDNCVHRLQRMVPRSREKREQDSGTELPSRRNCQGEERAIPSGENLKQQSTPAPEGTL